MRKYEKNNARNDVNLIILIIFKRPIIYLFKQNNNSRTYNQN